MRRARTACPASSPGLRSWRASPGHPRYGCRNNPARGAPHPVPHRVSAARRGVTDAAGREEPGRPRDQSRARVRARREFHRRRHARAPGRRTRSCPYAGSRSPSRGRRRSWRRSPHRRYRPDRADGPSRPCPPRRAWARSGSTGSSARKDARCGRTALAAGDRQARLERARTPSSMVHRARGPVIGQRRRLPENADEPRLSETSHVRRGPGRRPSFGPTPSRRPLSSDGRVRAWSR